jgi:sirohydrochlorin cobaltochelatase
MSTPTSQPPLILFAHGARDPRWAEPFEAMRAALRARQPARRVELAYLELMAPSLPEVAARLHADGERHARVVPLFLATGGHLRRDLPKTIEAIRSDLPGFTLDVLPPLGESPQMREAIVDWLSAM